MKISVAAISAVAMVTFIHGAWANDYIPSKAVSKTSVGPVTSASSSAAGAAARVGSVSASAPTVINNQFGGAGNGAAGGGGFRSGNWLSNLPAATAAAPEFGSGPCTGKGLGGSGQGVVGVSINFQGTEVECQIARLGNLDTISQRIQFAYLCKDEGREFQEAAANAGYPCPTGPADPAAPLAFAAPVVPPANQMPWLTPASAKQPVERPAWCGRAKITKQTTEASRTFIQQQCGG